MLARLEALIGDRPFRDDVLSGLAARPRAIPARWFYDRRGSELFEAITELPEYYPTRTERGILAAAADEIAALVGPKRSVVEFGSGSSTKTPLLLSAIDPAAYIPIDISDDFLVDAAANLARSFPHLPICPLAGDFTGILTLPEAAHKTRRLGFFPGSTIGNLLVPAAVDLLRAMAETLGIGSMLLIGIDRVKDESVLVPAYDDARGVTALFNLNLLHRINRELDGDIPVEEFGHIALWNEFEQRIEMHLEAKRDLRFFVDGLPFAMAKGERIHTENSLKFTQGDARTLLRAGGWTPIADWSDAQGLFSLYLAEARAPQAAP